MESENTALLRQELQSVQTRCEEIQQSLVVAEDEIVLLTRRLESSVNDSNDEQVSNAVRSEIVVRGQIEEMKSELKSVKSQLSSANKEETE